MLAGRSLFPPAPAAHAAMHDAVAPFVQSMPPRPEAAHARPATQRAAAAGAPGRLHAEGLVGGHKLFLRTGEYADGALGEISSACTRKARRSAA